MKHESCVVSDAKESGQFFNSGNLDGTKNGFSHFEKGGSQPENNLELLQGQNRLACTLVKTENQ